MHLIYIDDSTENKNHVFSGIIVPAYQWQDIFDSLKGWRIELRNKYGLYLHKELHATQFVAGRGNVSSKQIPKWTRNQIFKDTLSMLASIPDIHVISSCVKYRQDWAFERLLNRRNRTMRQWDSIAILVCDEGNENKYRSLKRKMSVYNPIPSMYGTWNNTSNATKNIPLDRIIEDPWFKDSSQSYFVQMADFCAYALLRQEVSLPDDSPRKRFKLNESYSLLENILFKDANYRDDQGVIR